jgi:hypothetical protein
VQVGGIGDRHEQPLAALDQRQHAMLGQQFVGDQLDDFQVRLDGFQIHQRHAEFLGGGDGDLARVGEAGADQMRDQVGVGFLRRGNSLRHGLLIDETILNQALWQALQHHALGIQGRSCVFRHGFNDTGRSRFPRHRASRKHRNANVKSGRILAYLQARST